MKILVMNAGSSSQKCQLYELGETLPENAPQPLWSAHADWAVQPGTALLTVTTAKGTSTTEHKLAAETSGVRVQIIEWLLATLWADESNIIACPEEIAVVGHRIVHGGAHYRESVFITPDVKATIAQLAPFAPLHNPASLEGIAAIEHIFGDGGIPQIAVFDTAFHRQIPLERTIYPGPYEWFEQGLRRYEFHGINHSYCAERSGQLLGRDSAALRIISCHLGNGCSLVAIADGISVDTTMGFTPLEGLMMGSRSGSVDPGLLLYLQREQGYSAEQLDHVLNFESGFKGVSGVSNDIRNVMSSAEQGNQRAQIALDLFVYRLRYFIGAMAASLDGVDVLVFTGGIGEHVPAIRARACEHFSFLNLHLDPHKNATCSVDQDISADDSPVRILVIHANEEWEIAQTCWKMRATSHPASFLRSLPPPMWQG